MSDGFGRRGPRDRSGGSGDDHTIEYDSELPSSGRAQRSTREGRGYWVDEDGRSRRDRDAAVWRGDETEEVYRDRGESASGRRARARRRMGLVFAVVVLGGLAVFAGLLLTGRVVVPGLSEKVFPIHYQDEIAWAATEYDQDPYLVAAVIKAESGYDPDAVSGASAYGLMQLLPSTAKERATKIGKWEDVSEAEMAELLKEPAVNIELGVAYLAYLHARYDGDSRLALAAYNAGFSNLDEWVQDAGGLQEFGLADIAFPETRQYVERVEHYYQLYKRIHPDVFALTANVQNGDAVACGESAGRGGGK